MLALHCTLLSLASRASQVWKRHCCYSVVTGLLRPAHWGVRVTCKHSFAHVKLSTHEQVLKNISYDTVRAYSSGESVLLVQAMVCRFSGVQGIVAFDFDNFMSMVQRSRKWQDPHTLRNVTVKQLQLDPWMQTVLTCLQVTILPASVEIYMSHVVKRCAALVPFWLVC